MTECSETLFPFEAHFSRQVVAQFEGSWLTTEGGSLLLRQADRKIGLLRRIARCFTDYRRQILQDFTLFQPSFEKFLRLTSIASFESQSAHRKAGIE
jgi:Transposase DDE domain group 1